MTLANHTDGALDREVRDLLANVACSVPAAVVRDVVSAARKDRESGRQWRSISSGVTS